MNNKLPIHIQMNDAEDIRLFPQRGTVDSAGYDIFSKHASIIPQSGSVIIPIPFMFTADESIRDTYKITLYLRSSSGIKHQIRLVEESRVNAIDIPFNQKEATLTLFNGKEKDFSIEEGEHFVQCIIREKNPTSLPFEIENVAKDLLKKDEHIVASSLQKEGNDMQYVLEEDVVIPAFSQHVLATGLSAKLQENSWLGIYMHHALESQNIYFANGIPVIDHDYYFADNGGHMYFAVRNDNDTAIVLKKGTVLATLKSERFFLAENEISPTKKRTGGIGHTTTSKKGR